MKTLARFIVAATMFSTPALAYQISVKHKPGKLRFSSMDPDSHYAKAGFQRGDVIKEINGKKVDDSTPLSEVDSLIQNGGRVKIERDGKEVMFNVKPEQL